MLSSRADLFEGSQFSGVVVIDQKDKKSVNHFNSGLCCRDWDEWSGLSVK